VGGTAITLYASYGDQELTEYAGTVGQPISWSKRFIYGPGLDEPVASYDPAGVLLYQFADVQGSVIAQINSAGQVTEKHGYTAYGLSNSLGTNTASYQYAGRRLDQDTGLYYNRARYYAPTLGRFLNPDPIFIKGGLNLYAYTGNDPLNGTDPSGQYTFQFGLSGSFSLAGVYFPLGFGFALDTDFHMGLYSYGGFGGSFGPDGEVGFSLNVSNAQTISDLTGLFDNYSLHAGAGYGGSLDYFNGPSNHGYVNGGGITVGAAAGLSGSAAVTNTWLWAPFGDGSSYPTREQTLYHPGPWSNSFK
jgi:RHS repeat-associated protein